MNHLRLRLLTVMGLSALTAAPVSLIACGARTGLPVWELEADAGLDADEPETSLIDAPDAEPDVTDIPDAEPDVMMTIRRPFLVGASLRKASIVPRDDWGGALAPAPALDPRTRAHLALAWADDGRDEHASIAAFARFTLLLLSVGAPPRLVAASQRASLDEIRHARDCFAFAARYGDRAVGPSALVVHDSLGLASLVEIAALAAQEGCLGETIGVALVEEALAGARDPEVVESLTRIHRDEMRHAELAWRFARWAIETGGAPVRSAVERAIHEAIVETRRTPIRDYGIDDDAWRAHGRLTCREARATSERAIREVILPCLDALLLATVPGTPALESEAQAGVQAAPDHLLVGDAHAREVGPAVVERGAHVGALADA
jgi:hypothetical protein